MAVSRVIVGQLLELVGGTTIVASILGALYSGGYQIVHWLRYAEWASLPVYLVTDALGIPPPNANWAGVQVALWWLLEEPLWVPMIALVWAGLALVTIGEKARRVTGSR